MYVAIDLNFGVLSKRNTKSAQDTHDQGSSTHKRAQINRYTSAFRSVWIFQSTSYISQRNQNYYQYFILTATSLLKHFITMNKLWPVGLTWFSASSSALRVSIVSYNWLHDKSWQSLSWYRNSATYRTESTSPETLLWASSMHSTPYLNQTNRRE
jgi:hypothetical protein